MRVHLSLTLFLLLMGCREPAELEVTSSIDSSLSSLSLNLPPIIGGILTHYGPTTGGTTMTLTGISFTPTSTVTFTQGVLSYSCSSYPTRTTTRLQCVTPVASWGSYTVTLTNPDGQTDLIANGFTFIPPAPTLSSISPTSGGSTSTTAVTLTGTGFLSGATVKLGTSSCTNVTVVSSTSITCTAPAHASGGVTVTVINPTYQSALLSSGFTYTVVTPPSNLVYSTNPAWYGLNIRIPSNTPSASGGAVTLYSILPALPTGLSLNSTTGIISGTPGATSPSQSYTVIAANEGGSTSTVLTLGVNNYGNGSSGNFTATALNQVINAYAEITDSTVSAGSKTFTVNPSNISSFAKGDLILIIQMQNSTPSTGGAWELTTIESTVNSTGVITVSNDLLNTYYSGTFEATSSSAAQIVKVPQYSKVTIPSGTSIIPSAWDGRRGGILAFKSTGTVTVNGTLSASGKGFRGGSGGATYGYPGENPVGRRATAPTTTSQHSGGGGGAYLANGSDYAHGGGGAYVAAGIAGTTDGTNNTSDSGDAGSTTYGFASLAGFFLGAGGGGSFHQTCTSRASGSEGGGIILISAPSIIVNSSGSVQSKGTDASQDTCADAYGGAGAGGSIYLSAPLMSIGTSLVSATGGGGRAAGAGIAGGAGSDGRIRLDYNVLSGTTSPTYGYNAVPSSTFSYAVNPMRFLVGTGYTENASPYFPSPSLQDIATFTISPALPTGLTLSASSGVIYGTPTVASLSTGYTVTATLQASSTTSSTTLPITANFTLSVENYGTSTTPASVTGLNTVINTYGYVTENIAAGATSLKISSAISGVNAPSFTAGDEILVIQMQNGSSSTLPYEFATISGAPSGTNPITITLSSGLTNAYLSGTAQNSSSYVTQIVKVPHYTTVHVLFGASIIPEPWDGHKGGVVAFRANNQVNIIGSINADGKGFRGGTGQTGASTAVTGYAGESWSGLGIQANSSNNSGGGGGSAISTGSAFGGGAGFGTDGASGDSATGTGGNLGTSFGLSSLSSLFLGPGGGGGASGPVTCSAGAGSIGGGIVLIYAYNLVVSGSITANGEDVLSALACGGGAGAGGSIYLKSSNMTLGTSNVQATGGAGDGTYLGEGGSGRIRLDSSAITGTTSPAAGHVGQP